MEDNGKVEEEVMQEARCCLQDAIIELNKLNRQIASLERRRKELREVVWESEHNIVSPL